MTGEIASKVVEDSLYGDLYSKGKEPGSFKYRMGHLKLDGTPITWEAFNLTENSPDKINISDLETIYKISKDDLSEEEKKNLERLLQLPRG